MAANDDKFESDDDFISFDVNNPATVFIAYDKREDSLPDWLDGWTNSFQTLGTTDIDHQIYFKDYPIGRVTLGANFAAGASGAESHYIVIVKEKAGDTTNDGIVLSIGDAEVEAGESASVPILLSSAPDGVSGFYFELALSEPSTAQITDVYFPDFDLNKYELVSESGVILYAIDIDRTLESGATDTTLAYIEIDSVGVGETDVEIESFVLQDDSSSAIQPQLVAGTVTSLRKLSDEIEDTLTVASDEPYELIENGFNNDALAYIDREYTVSNVPGYVRGRTYIRPANDDKYEADDSPFMAFDVNQDVIVFVAYDDRLPKPAWANSFTDTGDDVVIADQPHSILRKNFDKGRVELGANGGIEMSSMYLVIVDKAH
jgi:hypothetical protein